MASSLALCKNLKTFLRVTGEGILTGLRCLLIYFALTAGVADTCTSQPGSFEKNLELADQVRRMAESKGVSSTQLCLAWEMAQSSVGASHGFSDHCLTACLSRASIPYLVQVALQVLRRPLAHCT